MHARQQKHRNKHNCSDQERKIHYLCHDIGKKIIFGHERFLDVYPTIIHLQYMGLADRIYEDAIEVYLHLAANQRDHFQTAITVVVSSGPFHHRIVGLFGSSVGAPINASR
jgi:hypothetical protein